MSLTLICRQSSVTQKNVEEEKWYCQAKQAQKRASDFSHGHFSSCAFFCVTLEGLSKGLLVVLFFYLNIFLVALKVRALHQTAILIKCM